MSRLVAFLLFLSLCRHASAQSGEVMTLEEAVDYGLEHHTGISISEKQISYREWQVMSEKSGYLPHIRSSADYRYNTNLPVTIIPAEAFGGGQAGPREIKMGTKNVIQAGIDVEQPIYDPVTISGIREAEIRTDMAQADVLQVRKEVVLQIKRAYYQVVFSKDKLRISQDLERSYNRLLEIAGDRFDHDLTSAMAVEEVRQKQENQSMEVEINRMNLQNNLQRLKLAMEYPAGKNLRVADTSVYQLIDNFNAAGPGNFEYKKLPEYRKIELELLLNSEQSEGVDAQYLPSLNAYGFIGADYYDDALSPTGNHERWFRHSYLGARLQIPIFDGWNKNRQRQALNILNRQLNAEREKLAYTLQTREGILGDAVAIATQRAISKKNDYQWALTQYETQIADYNNGLAGYRDVVQAGLDLQIRQQEYLAAMLEVLMSRLDYEELTGNYD